MAWGAWRGELGERRGMIGDGLSASDSLRFVSCATLLALCACRRVNSTGKMDVFEGAGVEIVVRKLKSVDFGGKICDVNSSRSGPRYTAGRGRFHSDGNPFCSVGIQRLKR